MRFSTPVARIRSQALQEQPVDGGTVDEWFVLSVKGREAVSSLYELELRLLTSHLFAAPYDSDRVDELFSSNYVVDMHQEVSEGADTPGGHDPVIAAMVHGYHGVLRELEMENVARATPDLDGATPIVYRAVLVPRVWFLTQSVRTRLFQAMSVPEVLRHILDELGLELDADFEFRLLGKHLQREYLLQYDESDWAFLSRLCEHEGIFFCFEQTQDREKLVFGDHNEGFQEFVTLAALAQSDDDTRFRHVRFDPRGGVLDSVPAIKRLTRRWRQVPRSVAVVDYDYKTPSADVHAATEVYPAGLGQRVHYLEAKEYSAAGKADDVAAQVARLAPIRAASYLAERERLFAESAVLGLFAGMTFSLENHYDADLVWLDEKADKRRRYIVIASEFSLVQEGIGDTGNLGFGASLTLQGHELAYRPPLATPRPVVAGGLSAKVADRNNDPAADLDAQGQYALLLDIPTIGGGPTNGPTIKRFRMSQTFTGPAYGMHHPLHVGAEVLLVHLRGDPDRPVIAGSLPNFSNVPPVTARNATHGGVRSRNGVVDYINDDA